MKIQRSLLILPVNVPKFVEKAYTRGADSVMLDLEDAVPLDQKKEARELLKDSIPLAARGGAEVFVRVNNEASLLTPDVEAAVLPGVKGIFLPKVESAHQISALDEHIAKLEAKRGITRGSIRLSLHIESPLGMLKLQELAGASTRTESMSIGTDDYCLQLGVEASPDGTELFFPFCMMVTVSKAAGIRPMGILGSVAGFRDLDGFRKAAERGRDLGSTGAFCIHPDQVGILNTVFSPSEHQVEHASRVVAAFEDGLSRGRASVTLDGRMVDTPVYKRAQLTLERAVAVAELERRKAEAMNRVHRTDE
ncbi:MAG TPA: CoA ester lyase [Desulfomonilaceae bacterium]|nr:CoA ester lyase [Desulfomonilaceae bacterium]